MPWRSNESEDQQLKGEKLGSIARGLLILHATGKAAKTDGRPSQHMLGLQKEIARDSDSKQTSHQCLPSLVGGKQALAATAAGHFLGFVTNDQNATR